MLARMRYEYGKSIGKCTIAYKMDIYIESVTTTNVANIHEENADWEFGMNTNNTHLLLSLSVHESDFRKFICAMQCVNLVCCMSQFRGNIVIVCATRIHTIQRLFRNKGTEFHSECVGVWGMINNNLEATRCGVRDGVSFYKLSVSATHARHSICGFKAIHILHTLHTKLNETQVNEILNERTKRSTTTTNYTTSLTRVYH